MKIKHITCLIVLFTFLITPFSCSDDDGVPVTETPTEEEKVEETPAEEEKVEETPKEEEKGEEEEKKN